MRLALGLLIAAGVDINAEDDFGDTALNNFQWPDGHPSLYADILRAYGAR